MKIAIIGLGLIGGSLAKAFKKFTDYDILGYDKDENVSAEALKTGVIDEIFNFQYCDIIVSALYPAQTVKFIRENAERIGRDTIVTDCGGVKEEVCEGVYPIAREYGFTFIGMHPMAGIEKFGFSHSFGDLFRGASLVITPYEDTPKDKLDLLSQTFLKIGFGGIKISTPKEHDKVIAYTSQLAHVLSASYIKSPSALMHHGFSAGSFKDMTRVARLNETMWTELFLENADNLTEEIDCLIDNLKDFSNAIKTRDKDTLFELLKDGREKKELSEKI